MSCYVIGIDGGATRTRAAVLDGWGRCLGRGEASGCSATVASDQAGKPIRTAWTAACEQAGVAPTELSGAFLGVADVVTEADRQGLREAVGELGLLGANRVWVDHDIRIAWAGGLGCEAGIALIAGTGSSCYGRNEAGQSHQAGGWGHVIDDFGSGYRLAVAGLTAAAFALDRRGRATVLSDRLLEALEVEQLPELMRRLHTGSAESPGAPMAKHEIAGLAPVVLKVAEAGDGVAQELVDRAVSSLRKMIVAVAEQLALAGPARRVALAGSLAAQPAIAEPLTQQLDQVQRPVKVVKPRYEPVVGAGLLAIESVKTLFAE